MEGFGRTYILVVEGLRAMQGVRFQETLTFQCGQGRLSQGSIGGRIGDHQLELEGRCGGPQGASGVVIGGPKHTIHAALDSGKNGFEVAAGPQQAQQLIGLGFWSRAQQVEDFPRAVEGLCRFRNVSSFNVFAVG